MRLTCPNCGAQYEVPDEVIPAEGRDVQCSNCGDTWYQTHPAQAGTDETPRDDVRPQPARPASGGARPSPAPDRAAEPAPDTAAARRDLDPAVAEILRQEAEREAQLRAKAVGNGLESQPDLGLDDLPDSAAALRSRQAEERMARMRGEHPETPVRGPEPHKQRDLLPDIEEINSTLRASGDPASPRTEVGAVRASEDAPRNSGFARGFGLVVVLALVLLAIYVKAPDIARAVPQAEPALKTYVGTIDQGRVWLDAQVGGLIPQ